MYYFKNALLIERQPPPPLTKFLYPPLVATPFFYANRNIGGLGIGKISQEVDIWTISKAMQLLSSRDNMISSITNSQL